jgi:hypothetical protein
MVKFFAKANQVYTFKQIAKRDLGVDIDVS